MFYCISYGHEINYHVFPIGLLGMHKSQRLSIYLSFLPNDLLFLQLFMKTMKRNP